MVGAGSLLADTSPLDRGQATRSPPTDHTRLPNHQSGSSVGGAQSLSPWRHTPALVPSDQQLPASCLAETHDWEPPRTVEKEKFNKQNRDLKSTAACIYV